MSIYRRTVEPAAEPVTLAEAKSHLNITHSNDDTFIGTLIAAARDHAEQFTRRALVQQTWRLNMDDFPNFELRLDKPPVISVTSVKYYDIDNVQQTLVEGTDYTVDTYSEPGWLWPAVTGWPTVYPDGINGVEIIFVAGYSNSGASPLNYADRVPESIKAGILLHVGHLYEHRESVGDFQVFDVPMGYKSLMYPYRLLHI